MLFGVACMQLGLVASDEHAPALGLYVPPAGIRPVAVPDPQTMPRSPGAQVPFAPTAPVAPSSVMMPTTVDATPQFLAPAMDTAAQYLPVAEAPTSPFAFFGGFAGGLAVGVAFVYSLLQRTGQKLSNEARKLELGALSSVAPAEPAKSLVVKSAALQPYLAGGASLPAVLKQVTSGRAAIPAFGSELRAINMGRGRRVVVNMMAGKEFAYGLPGNANILGDFDPAGFLNGKDKLEVYRLREAELAHGRVSMLASLGFIVQEGFHPLFNGEGGPAGDVLPSLPVWIWLVLIGGIGLAESKRIAVGWTVVGDDVMIDAADSSSGRNTSALKEGYYPGDLGFDPLRIKPTDPDEFRLMQEKELSHCRLAMFAAAGFIAQESVSNATWGAYWAR